MALKHLRRPLTHPPRGSDVYFYLLSAILLPLPIIMQPLAKETMLLGVDNQVGWPCFTRSLACRCTPLSASRTSGRFSSNWTKRPGWTERPRGASTAGCVPEERDGRHPRLRLGVELYSGVRLLSVGDSAAAHRIRFLPAIGTSGVMRGGIK